MRLMTRAEAAKAGKLDSPEYALACRVRFACALDTKEGRDWYIGRIEAQHGKEYADELRRLAMVEWEEKKRRIAVLKAIPPPLSVPAAEEPKKKKGKK